MDVFSSCYSGVSVDFVCDRYSLEESKCKKSFDFCLRLQFYVRYYAAKENSG